MQDGGSKNQPANAPGFTQALSAAVKNDSVQKGGADSTAASKDADKTAGKAADGTNANGADQALAALIVPIASALTPSTPAVAVKQDSSVGDDTSEPAAGKATTINDAKAAGTPDAKETAWLSALDPNLSAGAASECAAALGASGPDGKAAVKAGDPKVNGSGSKPENVQAASAADKDTAAGSLVDALKGAAGDQTAVKANARIPGQAPVKPGASDSTLPAVGQTDQDQLTSSFFSQAVQQITGDGASTDSVTPGSSKAVGKDSSIPASGSDFRNVMFTFQNATANQSGVGDVAKTASPPVVQTPDAELPAKLIDQVVSQVKLSQTDGRSDLTVRLNPPELGSLSVRIVQDAQGITSEIQASSNQVRNLLQAHMPALMSALSDAGLRVDAVNVTSNLSFGSYMQNPSNGGAQQEAQNPASRFAGNGGQADSQPTINLAGAAAASTDNTSYSWLA